MRAAFSINKLLPVEPQAIEHNKCDSSTQIAREGIDFIFIRKNEAEWPENTGDEPTEVGWVVSTNFLHKFVSFFWNKLHRALNVSLKI